MMIFNGYVGLAEGNHPIYSILAWCSLRDLKRMTGLEPLKKKKRKNKIIILVLDQI